MSSPAVKDYPKLIQTLKHEMQTGLAKAEEAVMRQRVVTYWTMGRQIAGFLQKREGPEAPYLKRIGRDVGVSLDFTRKMVNFYRAYPRLPKSSKLSWAQYRALLTAPDEERARFERMALREGLGSERLYAEISRFRRLSEVTIIEAASMKGHQLQAQRGQLYHYKTLQSRHLTLKKSEIMVDVGFNMLTRINMTGASRKGGGECVRSVKRKGGYGLKFAVSDEARLYTYSAKVKRVIDADTLVVTVDCGFNFWMDVTARLFGINAPEKQTADGRDAYHYVKQRLKPGKDIVVKTYKTEKYGRYLADVYYLPQPAEPERIAARGIFLNQELLDQRLAEVYVG